MTFQNLQWLYVAVPLLLVMVAVRFWRRHYWAHSLVPNVREDLGGPNPILRMPMVLEGLAVGFLLVALLGPVYPFVMNRIERGGLQIMFVLDLSQSMDEILTSEKMYAPGNMSGPRFPRPGSGEQSKMQAVKATAIEFINKRAGDAIGLVVFSNNAYVVSPATYDHDSLIDYLRMVNSQSLVNEGFTAIGEGLATAQRFFAFTRERGQSRKGKVIVLFSDGDNNRGTDPLKEIEKAKADGTHIYFIGVALEEGASKQIAAEVPSTGGKFYDVRDPGHLKAAFEEIDNIEKGHFYTLQLTRQQPAYFIFVLASFVALTLRMALHGIPDFVELS